MVSMGIAKSPTNLNMRILPELTLASKLIYGTTLLYILIFLAVMAEVVPGGDSSETNSTSLSLSLPVNLDGDSSQSISAEISIGQDPENDEQFQTILITEDKEFKTFEYALQLLPQYRDVFPEINYDEILSGVSEKDWKAIIIEEIIDYIPTHLHKNLEPYVPQSQFFDCQKSIFTICMSVVDYLDDLDGIYEALNQEKSIFQLVSQSPNYVPLNGLTSYFVLIIRLIKHLPWINFSKEVQKKLIQNIEKIQNELVIFRKKAKNLYGLSEKIYKKCNAVFEHGPHLINYDLKDKKIDKEASRRPIVHFSDPKIIKEASKPTIGMIDETKLTTSSGVYKLDSLKNSVKLGLLVLIINHTLYLLKSLKEKFTSSEKQLSGNFYVKKWRNIVEKKANPLELAFLFKANFLLKSNSQQFKILCHFFKLEAEFLYEYHRRFKILKKTAFKTRNSQVTPGIENNLQFDIGIFNVEVKDNETFQKYLLSGNWQNSGAALLLTQQYLLHKNIRKENLVK